MGEIYLLVFQKMKGKCVEFLFRTPRSNREAWCPKKSLESICQAEQRWSWLKMSIPSHLFIQINHSKQENFVLLGRETANPCIGIWHGTGKQSCFVKGVGFHLKLMEAFRNSVVGKGPVDCKGMMI